jgi:hypothetical protein
MIKLPAQLKLKTIITLTTLGFLALVSRSQPIQVLAQAPEELTLTAIPTRLGEEGKLHAKPGEKLQTMVKIQNSSNTQLTVISQAQDFTLDSDGQTPLPIDGVVSNRWSLASWLVLSPAQQEVAAHTTKGVNVLIEIPEDALPGGHYAMVTHRPILGDLDVTAGDQAVDAGVTQKVGTLVYVIVDGPISEDAFVRNLNFPKLTELGPVDFNFTIESMSDVHIRPQINVEFRNWFGKKVDSVQIETKNVFPLSSRDFEATWRKVWGFGRYSAHVTASYGQSGRIAMATTHFWFFPVTLVLIGLIILLTMIASAIAIRRHLIHRKDDRSSTIASLEKKIQQLEANKTLQDPPDAPTS